VKIFFIAFFVFFRNFFRIKFPKEFFRDCLVEASVFEADSIFGLFFKTEFSKFDILDTLGSVIIGKELKSLINFFFNLQLRNFYKFK